jgi:hypothetical protein
VDEISITVRHGLRWLERTQRQDGSWAGESPLSTIHATTRCLRAFIGIGFPVSYPVVAKASRWLLRPKAEASIYHYFWRLGALSELEGVPHETLEHDFDVVAQTIERGVVLDRKLNYRAFLFDCAANCNMGGHFSHLADELKQQLSDPRIDVTPALWGFVGLERCGYATDELRNRVLDLIFSSIRDQNGLYHLNGLVVETSFLIFNVCRSRTLSQDPRVKTIIQGAARWVRTRQSEDGSWPLEPPLYNGDPQCVPYFTGVATRALAEYLRCYAPLRLAEVFVQDWRLHAFIRTAIKFVAALACLALLAAVGALLLPSKWSSLVTILGVASSAIEIVVFATSIRRRLSAL